MAYKPGTFLYLAAMYLSFCFPSKEAVAEELVLSERVTLAPMTVICDRPEEVQEMMGLTEMSNLQEAVDQVDGCGYLKTPIEAKAVAIGTFETDKNKYLLVRFDFLGVSVPPQYSIGAVQKLNKA